MREDGDDEDEGDALELRSVHRNPWFLALASLPFAAIPVALTLAVITGVNMLAALSLHAFALGSFATYFAWRRNFKPRLVPRRVRVEADTLVIGDERHARAEITGGFLVAKGSDLSVKLTRRGARPALELRVANEAEGVELLRRLDLGADQAVTRFTTMSRTQVSQGRSILAALACVPVMVALAVLGAIFLPAAGPAFSGVGGVLLVLAVQLAPTFVSVGADGVLTSWLGRERFVSHAEIRQVRSEVRGMGKGRRSMVILTLEDDAEVLIPVAPASWDAGRASALVTRIEQAREVYRSGNAAPSALLERGERSHRDWVSALRAGPVGGHRDAVTTKDALWRVIEDPAGAPLERAAAAVALGAQVQPAARDRLARAAKSTAAPKLRVALDVIATGEKEESIAEVLEALEVKAEKKSRRR